MLVFKCGFLLGAFLLLPIFFPLDCSFAPPVGHPSSPSFLALLGILGPGPKFAPKYSSRQIQHPPIAPQKLLQSPGIWQPSFLQHCNHMIPDGANSTFGGLFPTVPTALGWRPADSARSMAGAAPSTPTSQILSLFS
ncbi:hypothetical protein METBIDRAFT_30647 [Metschnikowia bicuspidata var. bicuspidata NRRL YB-4993]|uniref:Secreted protein n=1 Tax=Metschnikowia bicuspidata var. bicuspidata NRRL YB-4993 TaxID=869754 RepID=A0A1A0HKM0_9ASCO|nr:hypothetical protein METBIDRAFT_30647 [Metschnikowia bicuspidata var. bicuspidata NRRL YB-4993]OBA24353.1 hypothetical protein METBIDRAFT_30647 [Metschnikowia bicuspidata var. bicuspidata NRRL YB-4993]